MSLRQDGRRKPSIVDDLADRVAAVASGDARGSFERADRFDDLQLRALALAAESGGGEEIRRAAAVEFLSSAVTMLATEDAWEPGVARQTVVAAAERLDMAPGAALLAVFLRALGSSVVAQHSPVAVVEFYLWLLVELGPAEAASLWAVGEDGRLVCLTGAGVAPKSRRFRAAASAALHERPVHSPQVRAVPVERWDQRFAALAARSHGSARGRLQVWILECAAALTPVLERETLFQRNADRERDRFSGRERVLLRLGYDLHDGPLQELVSLSEELTLVRSQVLGVVADGDTERVAGRFDDVHARVAELDRTLRELARSMRVTSAVERPMEAVLRSELDLVRDAGITTTLTLTGSLTRLTESQRIVLYRVVQEVLANVRKHSEATEVDVRLSARSSSIELSISDNGRGFDVHETARNALESNRLGLAGVQERVQLLGGALRIEATVGEGVTVRASIPRWRPLERAAPTHYATAAPRERVRLTAR